MSASSRNPTTSLADDVAATKNAIAAQDGPVILVGHSYGGAVITEAGNDPKVAALVYITAFAPDKGESVNTLIANPPPGAPVPPNSPAGEWLLFLDKAKFAASFAADVDPDQADFMADFASSLGVRSPERRHHGPRLAGKAQLVPCCHRRQDDPAGRTAVHVRTRGCNCRRSERESRNLCVAACGRSRFYRTRRKRVGARGRISFESYLWPGIGLRSAEGRDAARKLRQADRRSIGLAFALHPLLTGDLTLAG